MGSQHAKCRELCLSRAACRLTHNPQQPCTDRARHVQSVPHTARADRIRPPGFGRASVRAVVRPRSHARWGTHAHAIAWHVLLAPAGQARAARARRLPPMTHDDFGSNNFIFGLLQFELCAGALRAAPRLSANATVRTPSERWQHTLPFGCRRAYRSSRRARRHQRHRTRQCTAAALSA
jgi:hypothetical protein